jgi:CheY-like chemotaxis protein
MRNDGIILLAEDNPGDAVLIHSALKAAGVSRRVVHVCDGAEAMSYLKGEALFANLIQPPAEVDLVLLDLDMPRVDGLQFLRWLRQEAGRTQLPVIVLTNSAFASAIHTAYLLGASSFLTKRLPLKQLAASMREACDFWLGSQGLADAA